MLIGLVVSVVGTRLINGGVSGLVALGVLPLAWIALYGTYENLLGAATPLFRLALRRFDPARALVTMEIIDSFAALATALAITLWRGHVATILITYLVLVSVLPVIGDLAEEFYAQQLATINSDDALAFNANILSLLTLIGIVFAMPLGALSSGRSIQILLVVNAVLSFGGFAIRFRSMKTFATRPLTDQDAAEAEGATGTPMKLRAFINDLVYSGPASPGMAFLLQFVSGLTGTYLFLWAASQVPGKASSGMAMMLFVFGIGATVGPQVARIARKRYSHGFLLILTTSGSITIAIALAVVATFFAEKSPLVLVAGVVFVVLSSTLSRCRIVLINTLRQTAFRGKQFSNIMSWSYSFSAVGTMLGLWAGLALGVAKSPTMGLTVAAAILIGVLPVMWRFYRQDVSIRRDLLV